MPRPLTISDTIITFDGKEFYNHAGISCGPGLPGFSDWIEIDIRLFDNADADAYLAPLRNAKHVSLRIHGAESGVDRLARDFVNVHLVSAVYLLIDNQPHEPFWVCRLRWC